MSKTTSIPKVPGRGWESHPYIVGRTPFATSSTFRGEFTTSHLHTGYLPRLYRNDLAAANDAGRVDYVVFSYSTPIAYHDSERGWIIPGVRYSTTTSKHQSTVRTALAMAGIRYNDK